MTVNNYVMEDDQNNAETNIKSKDDTTEDTYHYCPECNKSFCQAANLRRHLRIHTGEKPFKCTECERCFSDRSSLTWHRITHTEKRNFKCEICSKEFFKESHLMRHNIIHTNDRPFTCEICGKTLRRLDSLKYHVKTHSTERPFQCDCCGKRFASLSAKRKHERHVRQKRKGKTKDSSLIDTNSNVPSEENRNIMTPKITSVFSINSASLSRNNGNQFSNEPDDYHQRSLSWSHNTSTEYPDNPLNQQSISADESLHSHSNDEQKHLQLNSQNLTTENNHFNKTPPPLVKIKEVHLTPNNNLEYDTELDSRCASPVFNVTQSFPISELNNVRVNRSVLEKDENTMSVRTETDISRKYLELSQQFNDLYTSVPKLIQVKRLPEPYCSLFDIPITNKYCHICRINQLQPTDDHICI